MSKTMKYRDLGRTGLKVSEIGYGTWGLGGNAYGPVNDEESKRALRLSFELGVNLYDTSDLYGNGHSEELLGEVFKRQRKNIVIVSKGGTLPHAAFMMPQDFSRPYLRSALEGSLKRLQTDFIDVYLLHSPKLEDIRAWRVVETLEGFKKEGKINSYGISARSPQDALTAIEEFGFCVLEVNFNIIDQRAIETGLFDKAQALNLGVIVRTPLVFGYLSGKLKVNEKFGCLDHRANWPKEQLKRWVNAPNLFSSLNNGKNRTSVQLALRFCLDHAMVSAVIPGMLNRDQVKEDISVSSMSSLTDEELAQIKSIYNKNEFYDQRFKKVKND